MGEKIASLYAEIGADTSKFEKGLTSTKAGLSGMKISLIDIWAGLQLFESVAFAAADALNKTISTTVEYNRQVREMSQVTGLGAEEISRIIQVADDWLIDTDKLRTALAFLNRKGITPSIENLADLADSYVAAGDKSKWAEENTKKLGRGYQTLIPLLAKGGDALRAQAAAVEDNLIATDASIQAARNWEVQIDILKDTWEGFVLTIGQRALPWITDLVAEMNELGNAKSPEEFFAVFKKYSTVFGDYEAGISQLGKAGEEAGQKIEGAFEGAAIAVYDVGKAAQVAMSQLSTAISGAVGKEMKDFDQKNDDLNRKLEEVIVKIAEIGAKKYLTPDQKAQLAELKGELSGVKEKIDKLEGRDELTAGQSKRLSDLRDRAKELQSELGKFAGKQYLTPKQEEELKQLREEERLIQEEIRKTADEHEKATKRILFDILQQQLAVSGLTKEEMPAAVKMLAEIAEGWELIDPATATAMKAASLFFQNVRGDSQLTQKELDQLEAAMLGVGTAAQTSVPKASSTFNGLQTSANNARAAVERVKGAIDNLKSKTVTLTVNQVTKITTQYATEGGTRPGAGRQHGGLVDIGKPYIVGEAGPEIFVPNQSGRIVPNNNLPASGGDIYANITIIAQPTQNEEAIARRVLYRMRDVMRYQLAGGGIQGI